MRVFSNYTSRKGFTLIETIVAMTVFLVVLAIAGQAFNLIVSKASQYSKMEESNIEGVVGLEVMRHDIEQAGFGLPWGFSYRQTSPELALVAGAITYNESVDTAGANLNDSAGGTASAGNPPRAFTGLGALGAFSSDYIGIKASNVSRDKAAQRWSYIPYHNYSGSTGRESRPVNFATHNLQAGDKVIMVGYDFIYKDNEVASNYATVGTSGSDNFNHRLIVDPANNSFFSVGYSTTGGIVDNYLPIKDQQTYMVYGIDSSTTPRMPFNRADFFIKIPSGNAATGDGSLPPYCAPSTGVLYKATVNHSDGKYNYLPLLDCVADMQIVLGWTTKPVSDFNRPIDAYSTLPTTVGGAVSATNGAADSIKLWLTNAKDLREHLKVVKVYILAQEGKKDLNYTAPSSILVGDITANDGLAQKIFTPSSSPDQQHYRWKLYRIVTTPKNFVANQL